MLLLTGPAGSGKTFFALEDLRSALRRKDETVHLLVPTTTMAEHLRNAMAREGFVFRPGLIQTLARFIDPWTADHPEITTPGFCLLVERTLGRLKLPDFAGVAHLPGFHAKLARTLEEMSAAGFDAATSRHLSDTPFGAALATVANEVSGELKKRGLVMRSERLRRAASNIVQNGIGELKTAWLDGFLTLSDPELELIKAIASQADVNVTLPAADMAAPTRKKLLVMGFPERVLNFRRPEPARELVAAPTIEREADEIARRIIEHVSQGRSFREIGIIVRSEAPYVPLLRATFDRFGIPARFYFDSPLVEHAATRFMTGIIDALLDGWDHAATLRVLRLEPRVGISAAMDRFDFEIRKRLPGRGLERLREIADGLQSEDDRLRRILDNFAALEPWRAQLLTPETWAARCQSLRALYRLARPRDAADHASAFAWRSQSAALDAFDAAVNEAAQAFDASQKISLGVFWSTAKSALRLTPLRLADHRRDVVHVLSAYEARQWELPFIFICGMVEGQFPRYHTADPLLPDAARRMLKQNGIRIRSAEDLEHEEEFLFDAALSRATTAVVLSYPAADSRGEQNLRSLFLDSSMAPVFCRPVRPQRLRTPGRTGSCGIRADDLIGVLGTKHAAARPTALECYLQCPFQFFGRYTLRLESPPCRPEDRLDFRARGIIVHRVLAEWDKTGGSIDDIFDRFFRDAADELSFYPGYKTELLRAQLLADVRHFVDRDRWPADFQKLAEEDFTYTLNGGLSIRGRVDRLLKTPDNRGFVVDYKYSLKVSDKLKQENLLQGPLYLLAIERAFGLRAAGMFYCSLRDGVEYAGWGEKPPGIGKASVQAFSREWIENAVIASIKAVGEIVSGRIEPAPHDLLQCPRCDFRDVCRYDADAAAAIAESA